MSLLNEVSVDWPAPAHIRAACTQRAGGVSVGPYASLNLATHVGDTAAAVAANRERVRGAMGWQREPLWLNQVHGIHVFEADRSDCARGAEPPSADAAVTEQTGVILTVLVADCMPVLLCRRDGRGVAIAHAGWRGLAGGVIEAAVKSLAANPADVIAWLGPAIGPAHFEVGAEVRAAFCGHNPDAVRAFEPNARGRWQCDLHALASQRLRALGVSSVSGARHCTYSEPERFFSFRRDGVTGRFAAFVWMEPADTV